MALKNKILLDIVAELVGEDALPVVKYLKGKKDISEFKIAEEINLEVNRIRNMLYRLYANNIVTYHRKKDREKGWYISYWTLNPQGLMHTFKKMKVEKLDKLRDRLKKEEENENSFFLCPNVCTRLDFDRATEFDFRCPECGSLLHQQESKKTIDRIKIQIKELETELKTL